MKYAVLGMLLWVLRACVLPGKEDTVRKFIPGVYVRLIDHAYAKGHDTLEIRRLQGNSYAITRRSGYTPIRGGRIQEATYKLEKWTGLYDEASQVMTEQKHRRQLTFVPKENKLLLGASPYQKVK